MSVPFALVGGFAALWILHADDRRAARRADDARLRHPDRHDREQPDPHRPPGAELHAQRGHGPPPGDRAEHADARAADLHERDHVSVAGMAPLVVFGGAGSELYRGLGAVVIGGLLVSTVFTLFLTPALMSLMLDVQAWVGNLFRGRPPGDPPEHSKRAARWRTTRRPPRRRPSLLETSRGRPDGKITRRCAGYNPFRAAKASPGNSGMAARRLVRRQCGGDRPSSAAIRQTGAPRESGALEERYRSAAS